MTIGRNLQKVEIHAKVHLRQMDTHSVFPPFLFDKSELDIYIDSPRPQQGMGKNVDAASGGKDIFSPLQKP